MKTGPNCAPKRISLLPPCLGLSLILASACAASRAATPTWQIEKRFDKIDPKALWGEVSLLHSLSAPPPAVRNPTITWWNLLSIPHFKIDDLPQFYRPFVITVDTRGASGTITVQISGANRLVRGGEISATIDPAKESLVLSPNLDFDYTAIANLTGMDPVTEKVGFAFFLNGMKIGTETKDLVFEGLRWHGGRDSPAINPALIMATGRVTCSQGYFRYIIESHEPIAGEIRILGARVVTGGSCPVNIPGSLAVSETIRLNPTIDQRLIRGISQPEDETIAFILYENGKPRSLSISPVRIEASKTLPRSFALVDLPNIHGPDNPATEDYWMLAAFVNENDPVVSVILDQAISGKTIDEFDGYRRGTDHTIKQVYAIFSAMIKHGILYDDSATIKNHAEFENDPLHSVFTGGNEHDGPGQPIQTCADTWRSRRGNCEDCCVLMASVLEHVGIHVQFVAGTFRKPGGGTGGHTFLRIATDALDQRWLTIDANGFSRSLAPSLSEDQLRAGLATLSDEDMLKLWNQGLYEGAREYEQFKSAKKEGRKCEIVDIREQRRIRHLMPLQFDN